VKRRRHSLDFLENFLKKSSTGKLMTHFDVGTVKRILNIHIIFQGKHCGLKCCEKQVVICLVVKIYKCYIRVRMGWLYSRCGI